VSYFTDDYALELEGLRHEAGWWLRGEGDVRSERDVQQVFSSTPRSQVLGYDLIFAAPRPTSILIALDPSYAAGVVDAHRESVTASVRYLEERAIVVRDRRGGEDRDMPGTWSSIVSYTHGVNRHGEPHLHDHVLVGARTLEARSVLDFRSLVVHAKAADSLYRSSLRHELAERTPYVAWRSFDGVEHVVDQDEGYRALWGGHFAERGVKRSWRRDEVLEKWRSDVRDFEPEGAVLSPRVQRLSIDEHAFGAELEGSREITRRHLVMAWANAARFGQDATSLNRTIDALYPSLRDSRGVRESSIGVAHARMTQLVREHGARPLAEHDLQRWRQRSRDRSEGPERSR
jgi:hypothetical protein